jgi:ribonuclease P/MRP protein subunit RPP1
MKFFDLHVKTKFSNGENSIEEMVRFAEDLGYHGLAICDNFESLEKLKQMKHEISKISSPIEVYPGVHLEAKDVNHLSQMIDKVRDEVLILIVHGGDYNINRATCDNPKVDILAHPELDRIDSGLDESCLNAARENNVAIEMNFNEILFSYRKPRAFVLNHIAKNIKLCDTYKVPIVLASGARSKWEMRDPRQIISVANVLGLDLGKSFLAMTSTPQEIVENNKKTLEGKSPTEGVEVI